MISWKQNDPVFAPTRRGGGWVFPLVLGVTAVICAVAVWLGRPVGLAETVHATVVGYHIPQGKADRRGNTRVMLDGQLEFVQLPLSADCRPGDVIKLSRQSREHVRSSLSATNGQPCRRATPPFRY